MPHVLLATLGGHINVLRTSATLQADILLTPGSHASEAAVNKQLADKERVAAALENPSLLQMVDRCLGSLVA